MTQRLFVLLVVVGLTIPSMGADPTWSLSNPTTGQQYLTTSTITGGGMTNAPTGSSYMVEVIVNNVTENSQNGTSGFASWSKSVPPPTSGQWTASDTAEFKLTVYVGTCADNVRTIKIKSGP
jgi:hypothetical protein